MSVTLREIIAELVKRDEVDWAEACAWFLPIGGTEDNYSPMIDHGFSYDDVLDMTLDEIEVWMNTPPKPAKYDGWNYYRGKSA